MATVLLAAVGGAVGAGFGGTVLGLSGAVIGRAAGAIVGQAIDQRMAGSGSMVVETGRVERFRVMGASEGGAIGQIFGRVRVAGQVIWATRFLETMTETSTGGGGGKGGSRQPSTTVQSYSYSVSLAIALCEGAILRVGRIWADGNEVTRSSLNLRVYPGTQTQLPDAKIEAVEGVGQAPAYRGIAYVVIEDLQLEAFGNRVPQFTFEVVRAAQGEVAGTLSDLSRGIRAVALIPGSGEYALATTAVHYPDGPGQNRMANMSTHSGATDLVTSLDDLRGELPNVRSVSLVVSWFGDDLRCSHCRVMPRVEQRQVDGAGMPWRAGGLTRAGAGLVPTLDGRPVYGGTPADGSVIEAIRAIRAGGQEVMFYPFLLMEQLPGNLLPDPWTGEAGQPALPWRGRITTSVAPDRAGTPDRTNVAEAEAAAFFGAAAPSDFARIGQRIFYSGPPDWGYRRFILHYAHLCAMAGGVDSFCIGSELRGITRIRGDAGSFPAVAALRQLAADVREILGPGVQLSYAADWSEYAGFAEGGDRFFHLDALWADPNIDFIGIDNYMPLSDWRDGETHADADWGTIHALDYLTANVAGGEGFDWHYDSAEAVAAQRRTPIIDAAHGEDWIYRYKDLRSWWEMPHHDRLGGVRAEGPTAWVPRSKPIRFTELGCPAIDKGSNEPNRFVDPKSSESALPRASSGARDDLIQMQYLRATIDYWADPANNPAAPVPGGRMVDMLRAHVWAWDARPFPAFPNLGSAWSDGANYAVGHWQNGRATNQSLAAVVADICERSGVTTFDVSRLHGLVRGYAVADVGTARAALQPLMLAYGFDAVERNGVLTFLTRDARVTAELEPDHLAVSAEIEAGWETARASEAEVASRVRLGFVEADGDFATRQIEAAFPDATGLGISQSEVPLLLTPGEARAVAERWLSESRLGRDTVRLALPRSRLAVGAGDVVRLDGLRYRIDRIEQFDHQLIEATRIEQPGFRAADAVEERPVVRPAVAPVPVYPVFLDLPLLDGSEQPHAPHIAVSATPWPGPVAVWSAAGDNGYALNRVVSLPCVIGLTETPMGASRPGLEDRGPMLRVRVFGGSLSSAEVLAVLNGGNLAAIGDGSADRWEVFQFGRAELVAPGVYDLGARLRGQAGSDGVMPPVWHEGSTVVFLGPGAEQIRLPQSARMLERSYRIGPAQLGYDSPAVVLRRESFAGNGLRPYRPCHLRAVPRGTGDLDISWIRRTRLEGDGWTLPEVPLGEDREAYLLRVTKGAALVREVSLDMARWTYAAALRATDQTTEDCQISVAQVSDRFGAGPFVSLSVSA